MKIHEIKLHVHFASDVLDGRKNFEVRLNDRGYQTGDEVRFIVVDNLGNRIYHILDDKLFTITYVLSGWGIEQGYVVFGLKEKGVKNERTHWRNEKVNKDVT